MSKRSRKGEDETKKVEKKKEAGEKLSAEDKKGSKKKKSTSKRDVKADKVEKKKDDKPAEQEGKGKEKTEKYEFQETAVASVVPSLDNPDAALFDRQKVRDVLFILCHVHILTNSYNFVVS